MFEKQISNLSNFQGVQLESDISVITVDDGINHTYCSKIKWEKDNRLPIGAAQLIMPYSKDIASYWMKYSGAVVIHANLNSKQQAITQAMMKNFPLTVSLNLKNISEEVKTEENKEEKQIHLQNDEYNYSYVGKVYRFKQIGKTFVIYLEDLGWKFLQKVPKDFRSSFVAGQTLDDAFQAICEFMGINFAYSIKDLSEYNFSADGYSVEKDGAVIEDTPSILKEWSTKDSEEEEEDNEEGNEDEKMADRLKQGAPFEASGLIEYNRKKKELEEKKKNAKNKKEEDKSLNSEVTNAENNLENNLEDENKNEKDEKSVDAKIEKYQEEFDEKIKNLFIGNTFYNSNIADPVLNYDMITIEPKDIANANTSSTGGGVSGNSDTSESDDSSAISEDNRLKFNDYQNRLKVKNAKSKRQTVAKSNINLSVNEIKKLSPAMAATMSKNPKYTLATIALLKMRARKLL